MTIQQLDNITSWLKWKIFREMDQMYADLPEIPLDKPYEDKFGTIEVVDLIDVIASLHNLLYEEVTGERYNYMFHWANKVGAYCQDDIFDHIEGEE